MDKTQMILSGDQSHVVVLCNPAEMKAIGFTKAYLEQYKALNNIPMLAALLMRQIIYPYVMDNIAPEYKTYHLVTMKIIPLENEMLLPVVELVQSDEEARQYTTQDAPKGLLDRDDVCSAVANYINRFMAELHETTENDTEDEELTWTGICLNTLDHALILCSHIPTRLIKAGYLVKHDSQYYILIGYTSSTFMLSQPYLNAFEHVIMEYGHGIHPYRAMYILEHGQIISENLKALCESELVK